MTNTKSIQEVIENGEALVVMGSTNSSCITTLNTLIDELRRTDADRIIVSVSDTPDSEERGK